MTVGEKGVRFYIIFLSHQDIPGQFSQTPDHLAISEVSSCVVYPFSLPEDSVKDPDAFPVLKRFANADLRLKILVIGLPIEDWRKREEGGGQIGEGGRLGNLSGSRKIRPIP